jgi:hypothetical protein
MSQSLLEKTDCRMSLRFGLPLLRGADWRGWRKGKRSGSGNLAKGVRCPWSVAVVLSVCCPRRRASVRAP